MQRVCLCVCLSSRHTHLDSPGGSTTRPAYVSAHNKEDRHNLFYLVKSTSPLMFIACYSLQGGRKSELPAVSQKIMLHCVPIKLVLSDFIVTHVDVVAYHISV